MLACRQIIAVRGGTMRTVFRWRRKGSNLTTKEASVPVVEYLQKVNIFQGLTQEEIEELFDGVMVRQCTTGTVFFGPEDSTEWLFILKEGRVELYRLTPGGKRLVTRRIEPGTIFGEMGLLGQTLQGCFAEATEDSLVCVATKEDILSLLKQHPDVAIGLLSAIGNHLIELQERLEQTAFSPVKVRLANFLLANMDTSTGVFASYTHAEIGDTIGALRSTVTEILSEMQGQGLLEVGHKRIHVLNRTGLQDIAQGEGAVPR